jgi:hypothetical protein
MAKIYKLSPEVAEQLSMIETKAWPVFVIFFVVTLVAHFALSFGLYLVGYLDILDFLLTTFFLTGALLFYLSRKPAYLRQLYFSYEIELSDQSITFRQGNQPAVKIRQDEIIQIREILPEGEIYIKGKKKGQSIDVYALLLRENLEIKEELAKWQKIETASLSWPKLSQPLMTILLAFVALGILIQSFSDPNATIMGLTILGYSIISFFPLKAWPVRDQRIKNLLWVILIPAYISVPLAILSVFWSVYLIVGTFLEMF